MGTFDIFWHFKTWIKESELVKSSVYSKQIGVFKKMTFWSSVANAYALFPPHPENPKENPVTQQTLGPNQVKPK